MIIDEISLASNVSLYQVHKVFKCESELPFARLPVLICVDFYQVLPVIGLPIHVSASSR